MDFSFMNWEKYDKEKYRLQQLYKELDYNLNHLVMRSISSKAETINILSQLVNIIDNTEELFTIYQIYKLGGTND